MHAGMQCLAGRQAVGFLHLLQEILLWQRMHAKHFPGSVANGSSGGGGGVCGGGPGGGGRGGVGDHCGVRLNGVVVDAAGRNLASMARGGFYDDLNFRPQL